MLQGRLTAATRATAVAVVLTALTAACGDPSEPATREPLDGPVPATVDGTAGAETATCGVEASGLRIALDAYERSEGEPPADEAALVDAGFLRAESELWDVVGGELVAVAPACAAVDPDPDATEIVTSTESPPSADEVFGELSDADIEALGGPECARELAAIYAAGERFVADTGAAPPDLDALVDAGLLTEPPTRWGFADGDLVPADGGGCTELDGD